MKEKQASTVPQTRTNHTLEAAAAAASSKQQAASKLKSETFDEQYWEQLYAAYYIQNLPSARPIV